MKRSGRNKTCPTCGNEFYVPPSRIQTWCSQACVPWDVINPPGARRKAKPRNCIQCGEEFYASPSEVAKGRKFCSRECWRAADKPATDEANEARRRANGNRFGDRNPNFKNGLNTGRQIRGFTIKAKGESCCRNCGGTKGLGLHHAIPRSMCRASRAELLNGVPLCAKCHLGWHRRSLTICREVFTAEEWAYVSSVQLTGQRIEAWLDDRYPPRSVGVQLRLEERKLPPTGQRTHCPHGHPYTGDNLYVVPNTGHRQCRTCHRLTERARRDAA